MNLEEFMCPLRHQDLVAHFRFPGPDQWRQEPNGDYTCSYCGGMHPEQFLNFCKEVVESTDLKVRIEYIGYKGKFYVERPTVRNAGEGAIKARILHIWQWCAQQGMKEEERDIIIAQINEAIKVSEKKFNESFKSLYHDDK